MASIIKSNTYADFNGNTILTADSTGALTTQKSNYPVFTAKPNGSSQSIPNTTFTTLTFWDVVRDTNNGWDSTNNRYTIPTGYGGLYQINVIVALTTGTDFDEFALRLRTNNNVTNFLYVNKRNEYNEANWICAIVELSEGENLTLDLYHNRGSAVSADGLDYKGNYSICRLGS